MGKAINYTLNQWPYLKLYIEYGQTQIDNNLVENAIRPSALGKKNWLFIGHPKAGQRSAIIYTIVQTCRQYNIEPFTYLQDVLKRLPNMKNKQVHELLPGQWKPVK